MLAIDSSLTAKQLAQLAKQQVDNFFPDVNPVSLPLLEKAVASALPRLEYCFSKVNNKYFFDGKNSVFDHLHGDQYAMWLYFLSNELFKMGEGGDISKKLFLLNKLLHGCDIYYEVGLPEIFLLVHPLGTVLGRGSYQDYLVAYQKCGVGSNHDIYPTMGKHFTLRPGSSILGNCVVGDNVGLAADSLLLDTPLPENTLYIGSPKNHFTRAQTETLAVWC